MYILTINLKWKVKNSLKKESPKPLNSRDEHPQFSNGLFAIKCMDVGKQVLRRDVRRHIRSPSEVGMNGWFALRLAVMEKPHATDIIDKKTVIAMIGLPVFLMLYPPHYLGNRKELHSQNASKIFKLERFQGRSIQRWRLSSLCRFSLKNSHNHASVAIQENLPLFLIQTIPKQWNFVHNMP